LFECIIKTVKREENKIMTTYKVTWKEMWATEEMTFINAEEAEKWARMKKAMNYKEVKIFKVETTEIKF